MAEVTVKQFAEVVGIPVERLLSQLEEAGLGTKDPDAKINDEEKLELLTHLRRSHGKQDGEDGPRKITLKRRSQSELKLSGSAGRTKTVNVEVRKRRTYVKRSDVLAEEEQRLREEQEKRDAEEARIREEQEKQEAEAREKEEAEKARQEEEERARREAEDAEKQRQDEAEAEKAREDAAVSKEDEKTREAERKEREEAETRRQEEEERLKAEREARKQSEEDEKRQQAGRGKKSPYGRQQLHVSQGKAGRRKKKGGRRGGGRPHVASQHGFEKPSQPVVREVPVPESISVGDLAQKMAVKANELIKVMMNMGVMATINQVIDQETAVLVVEEMGHKPKVIKENEVEQQVLEEVESDSTGEEKARSPVVTVMGHVDHGKTSLLDYIRKAKVASGEAGGITQHIGAYKVGTDSGEVTFLDTPGHSAFTAMRARGADLTDIAVLVVAADDGVMPQTIESIKHARAAEIPVIVAVNKMDKEEADPDRVKNELSQHEVIPEDWGGETQFIEVSAQTGDGIEDLLEAIVLQAELLELKAADEGAASGVVIESSLEKGRGPVATVLVQKGRLKQGEIMLAGQEYGRVRAMFDETGRQVDSAGPSTPVVVLGLSGTPAAGDDVLVVPDERKAREVAEFRQARERDMKLARQQKAKLENMFSEMEEGDVQTLNLLVKADVQGSAEALQDALTNLSHEEVKVKVISAGIGGINESDVNLAAASEAVVIGFNVRADGAARRAINEMGVDVRYYSVIYEALDDVKKAISGMLSPEQREEIVGVAEVLDIFRSPKFGNIAGCLVQEGVVKRHNPIRVLRDNVVIFEGELESLRRFKDDVNEVKAGTECGIGVKDYNDVKVGDQIECYERYEVERTV